MAGMMGVPNKKGLIIAVESGISLRELNVIEQNLLVVLRKLIDVASDTLDVIFYSEDSKPIKNRGNYELTSQCIT